MCERRRLLAREKTRASPQVWVHKTSNCPPARRVSGHACACVMASLLPLFKISIFDFGIVVLFLLRFSYISSSVFFFFHLINQLVNLYSNTHICALEVKSTTLYHFSSFS